MSDTNHFSKETAKAMSILEVAESLGMEMRRFSHNEYYWSEHDSFKINVQRNNWRWYSQDRGGDVIELVKEIKGVSFKEAMQYLETGRFPEKTENNRIEEKQAFQYTLEQYEQPFDSARKYLKEIRGLSDKTIDFFYSQGVIAQANKKAKDGYIEPVIVFKNKDTITGDLIGASLQGITENHKRYSGRGYLKQIMYHSDGKTGFNVTIGEPNRVMLFESPIDLMSYYELYSETISNTRLVAMEGLKETVLAHYFVKTVSYTNTGYEQDRIALTGKDDSLDFMKYIIDKTTYFSDGEKDVEANRQRVILAVDNDEAGNKWVKKIEDMGLPFSRVIPPNPNNLEKVDWNDVLKEQKGMNEMAENKLENAYWQIEFMETIDGSPNYSHYIVTPELIQKLIDLDNAWHAENNGYSKVYFDYIENNSVVDRGRIDLGDGSSANSANFEFLLNQSVVQQPIVSAERQAEINRLIADNIQIDTVNNRSFDNRYWQLEFREKSSGYRTDFVQYVVTPEMIQELIAIDNLFSSEMNDNYQLYFEYIENNDVVDRATIDLGSDTDVNFAYFENLSSHSAVQQPIISDERQQDINQSIERHTESTIWDKIKSEYTQALEKSEDTKKVPGINQEQNVDRTNGGTDSLQPKAEGSVKPVSIDDTFEQTVTSHPTLSYPLLHFSTNYEKVKRKVSNYHLVTEKDLRKLNQYAPSIQNTANWYANELANQKISYIYLDKGEHNVLQVTFKKENFIHLTGIRPFEIGKNAGDFLDDFIRGNGDFNQMLISNAIKDKLQVLPMLPDILDSTSFVLNDLSSVEKLHELNFSEAIKSKDEDFLLLFKDVSSELVPASLMKLKGELKSNIKNVDEKIILGVYRERDGIIEQLSINEEYVKDGGKEMLFILENKQYEEVVIEPVNAVNFTQVLDTAYNVGVPSDLSQVPDEFRPAWERYIDYANRYDTIDQIVQAAEQDGLLNKESDFYVEYAQDKGIDIEKSKDSDGDGISNEEEKIQGTDPNNPLSNTKEKVEKEVSVGELIANKDFKGLSLHLREGIRRYVESDQFMTFLSAMSKFHNYSPTNIQMILQQMPHATHIASYDKWRNDFQRHVKKGEKGLRIRVPVITNKKDQDGNVILDEFGNPETQLRFKFAPVFDVSQTDGKELPQPINLLDDNVIDYQSLYRATRQVSLDNNVPITFEKISDNINGYYHPTENRIVISDKGMSEAQIMKTVFHEMAHSQLHKDTTKDRNIVEFEAESVAYVVSNHFGIDSSDYSFGYLFHWIKDEKDFESFEKSLGDIQKTASDMIQKIDTALEKIKSKTIQKDKFAEKLDNAKEKQHAELSQKNEVANVKKTQAPPLDK